MKEFWVNVYEDGFGKRWLDREDADLYVSFKRKLLYRIHVRMK